MQHVYLLHMTYADGRLEHYVGYTNRLNSNARLKQHKEGKGSAPTKAAYVAGARIERVYVWPEATLAFESMLIAYSKKAGYGWCHICDPTISVFKCESETSQKLIKPLPIKTAAHAKKFKRTFIASHGTWIPHKWVDDLLGD